eukprot:gb/GECG01007996.1/.p1 GENE.gb/GECG01007996.1/~~gb/GECG01007996.1/.p1  ORF type:complete len:278 (+),score=19.76 gb/GECG01007996.1/:1-834(+)
MASVYWSASHGANDALSKFQQQGGDLDSTMAPASLMATYDTRITSSPTDTLGKTGQGAPLVSTPAHVEQPQWSPLHYAAATGDLATAKTLLEHGAHVSKYANNGAYQAIHLSSRFGHDKVTLLLLSYGADANSFAEDNLTPLHFACAYNHPNTAQILINHGARADVADSTGQTALDYANSTNNSSLVAALTDVSGSSESTSLIYKWLTLLHLQQYFPQFVAQGFDDIKFIASYGKSCVSLTMDLAQESFSLFCSTTQALMMKIYHRWVLIKLGTERN